MRTKSGVGKFFSLSAANKIFFKRASDILGGRNVLDFLSRSSPLCNNTREADFTVRSETEVVSHSSVDFRLQGDEDFCDGRVS